MASQNHSQLIKYWCFVTNLGISHSCRRYPLVFLWDNLYLNKTNPNVNMPAQVLAAQSNSSARCSRKNAKILRWLGVSVCLLVCFFCFVLFVCFFNKLADHTSASQPFEAFVKLKVKLRYQTSYLFSVFTKLF